MSRYSSSVSRHSTLSSGAGPATVLRNDCVLYLTVLSARDLKTTQKIGVQDPYCVVYLVSGGKAATEPTFKTSTHDNGGGLRFDEDVVVIRLVYVCFVWRAHWHLGCRYVCVCAGTEPQWNEKGTILIPDVASDVLKIKVRNENWVGRYVVKRS